MTRPKHPTAATPLLVALVTLVLCASHGAEAGRGHRSLKQRIDRKLAQMVAGAPDTFPYPQMPMKPGAIVNGPAARGIAGDVPYAFTQYSSVVNPPFVGPYQTIKAAIINDNEFPPTATFPLYRGTTDDRATGREVAYWYILTDISDPALAEAQGVNAAPKLAFATGPGATRTGHLDNELGLYTDGGYVDFSPVLNLTAGAAPNYFPPTVNTPGSIAVDGYTPLVNINGVVYNMPIIAGNVTNEELVAWCSGIPEAEMERARTMVHDKVVAICPASNPGDNSAYDAAGFVTLRLTQGWSWGRPILYLSTDASNPLLAALETSTLTPDLTNVGLSGDDVIFSPIEDLFTIVNGYTNGDINPTGMPSNTSETQHPQRQGLNSALRGDPAGPLNILGGIPSISTDYSPVWDVTAVQWTEYAIRNNYRFRIIDQITAMGLVARGFLEELGTTDSFAVNCPVVKRYL